MRICLIGVRPRRWRGGAMGYDDAVVARRILVALFLAAGSACQMQRPVARGMPPGASTVCVFDIRGVRALLRDTPGGMDVTLEVVGEADELRRRARAALSGDYPVRPETKAIEQSVRASIRDEPEGLTINVIPLDPHDLERIRGAIRHRIDEATSEDCKD